MDHLTQYFFCILIMPILIQHQSTFVAGLTDFCREAIGMKSRVITDSQLTASSLYPDRSAAHGRFDSNIPWCAKDSVETVDTYFQVDFGQDMGITRIDIQGDNTYLPNYIKKFKIQYSFDGVTFRFVTNTDNGGYQDFVGISGDGTNGASTKVNDFTRIRFNGRYIRVIPVEFAGNNICLRMELYGCPYVCREGLGLETGGNMPIGLSLSSSSTTTESKPDNARLKASTQWCSEKIDQSQYFHIDLGKIMTISGIAVQGSSSADNWVKSFSIEFGDDEQTLFAVQYNGGTKVFTGNSDRDGVVLNWFSPKLETRHLRIKPKSWNTKICMRTEIIGCDDGCFRAIGLERHIIPNSAFKSRSSYENSKERGAKHGRLNNYYPACGYLPDSDNTGKEWLAVDIGVPMVIKGFSMQGDPFHGPNVIKEMKVEYSFDGNNWKVCGKESENIEKIFAGNNFNAAATFNRFDGKGISARHLRFRANKMEGNHQCFRIELYGCPQYCTTSLKIKMGSTLQSGTIVSSSTGVVLAGAGRLFSTNSWTPTAHDNNQFFEIKFSTVVTVSGIALQGNPKEDKWLKKFEVHKGDQSSKIENRGSTLFVAHGDRDTVINFWFENAVETNVIRVVPREFHNQISLRMDVLGCLTGCNKKLGLESKAIVDDDIKSSSAFDTNSLAKFSRLNTLDKSWISCRTASTCGSGSKETGNEWIDVCLNEFKKIKGIILQGPGASTTDRVQTFSFIYRYSPDGIKYEYKTLIEAQKFSPKTGRFSSAEVFLPQPIFARCLRLKVLNVSGGNAALRWEVLGCNSVLKPTLSIIQNEYSVRRGATLDLKCEGMGQPGIVFEWYINSNKVTKNDIYTLSHTDSDGSLSGKTISTLKLSAIPSKIGATSGTCTITNVETDLFHCVLPVKCSASYGGHADKVATDSLLNITEIKGKATKPTSFTYSVKAKEVTVKWDTPGDVGDFPFKHYQLKLQHNSVVQRTEMTTGKSFEWKDLSAFTDYHCTITYVNEKDVHSAKASITFKTKQDAPTAPREVTLKSTDPKKILVKWKEPNPTNGIIHKYKIKYSSTGSEATYKDHTLGVLESTLDALEPYTDYKIQIQAFTDNGKLGGKWSAEKTIRTAEGKPTEPKQLVVIENTNGIEVKMNWAQPTKLNGIFRHYKVSIRGTKNYNSTFIDSKEYNQTNAEIAFKSYGATSYLVEISAVTGGGEGNKANTSLLTPLVAPPIPAVQVRKGSSEKIIKLFPSSNIHGPIRGYVLFALNGLTTCQNISGIPISGNMTSNIRSFSHSYNIELVLGEKKLKGANITLPLVGNFTFCYRAFSQFNSSLKYGSSQNFTIERRSLEKPKPVSALSETSFTFHLLDAPTSNVKYFHICVVELRAGTTDVGVSPDEYPPSTLKQFNASDHAIKKPYITAEFAADDLDKLRNFQVGDGKEYSRLRRQKRSITNQVTYFNAPLSKGKTYSVFQRAFESSTMYYTSPWLLPVAMGSQVVQPDDDDNTLTIVMTLLAVFVVSILIVVLIITVRRRKLKSGDKERSKNTANTPGIKNPAFSQTDLGVSTLQADGEPDSVSESGFLLKEPLQNLLKDPRYPPVSLQAFAEHCSVVKRDCYHALSEEYSNLNSGQQYSWDIAVNDVNKSKNRFANIGAYNHSRVKLQEESGGSDYINANFIKNYGGQCTYIASQGPTPSTVNDFWRMIWDHKVPAIIMLTNFMERAKKKCEHYWPKNGSNKYGDITVELLTEETYADYSIKRLIVSEDSNHSARQLTHFHFISWPDHGVPEHPTALLNFRRRFRNLFPSDKMSDENVVIHCSAGVGRTGTFICIDAILESLQYETAVDIFNYVNFIRTQRIHMVQTEEQYVFVYDAILEDITCGKTEITAQDTRLVQKQLNAVDKNGRNGYQNLFKRLADVTCVVYPPESTSGRKPNNMRKNRNPKVIPRDNSRVVLQQSFYENDDADYINATYVNGYKNKDAFIATQNPLPDTLVDFWAMVYQRNCGAIVMLNRTTEKGVTYPPIYPEENSQKFGLYTVTLVYSVDIVQGLTKKRLSFFNETCPDDVRESDLFCFSRWPEDAVPKDSSSILILLREVEKSQQQCGNNKPTVVMCSDGTGRTGTFIALTMLLDRFKVEGLFDVFQTVKKIRYFRPEFVSNVQQYKFCHSIILAYIESFSDYSNFS